MRSLLFRGEVAIVSESLRMSDICDARASCVASARHKQGRRVDQNHPVLSIDAPGASDHAAHCISPYSDLNARRFNLRMGHPCPIRKLKNVGSNLFAFQQRRQARINRSIAGNCLQQVAGRASR